LYIITTSDDISNSVGKTLYNTAVITIYFNTARRKKLQVIEDVRHGSWIHVTNATHTDLQTITELTGLSLADIDDSLDPLETPRIEYHDDVVIIFLRQPITQGHIHTETLTIIVTNQYFITISPSVDDFIHDFLRAENPPATTQTTKLLLLVLLKLTRSFTQQVKMVRNTVLSQERSMIENVTNQEIVQLIHNEEILNQYLSALTPMRTVLEALLLKKYIRFHEDDNDLLEDLLISIRQSVDVCQVNLKSIQNLRDSYQIIFTNRLNTAVQTLTVLTIVLTIPTIIGSFYGMNVTLPFTDSVHAFPAIVGFSIGLSLVFLWLLRRSK